MSNGPRLRQSDFATMNGDRNSQSSDGLIRRSWHAMADVLSPFSSGALASLPKNPQGRREREIRADAIPEGGPDVIRDYNSINTPQPVTLRVPKKIATPIKVEGKVWFANERSEFGSYPSVETFSLMSWLTAWISYLNAAVLLGTLSLALFNASKDPIGRYFAYVYAVISVGILVRLVYPSPRKFR